MSSQTPVLEVKLSVDESGGQEGLPPSDSGSSEAASSSRDGSQGSDVCSALNSAPGLLGGKRIHTEVIPPVSATIPPM